MSQSSEARRRRLYRAYATSEGNQELYEIIQQLEGLVERIDDFVKEHKDECSCPYCSFLDCTPESPVDTETVRYDLNGLSWAIEQGTFILNGYIVPPGIYEVPHPERTDEAHKPPRPKGKRTSTTADEPAIAN